MVYLDINGRCGNQLFQYAFARKAGKKNGDENLYINFYNVERWRKNSGDDTFSDQLRHFNVKNYTSSVDGPDSLIKYGAKRQKRAFRRYMFIRKLANKFGVMRLHTFGLHMLNAFGVYREDESKDNRIKRTGFKNIFIRGYFENSDYFDDIREELLEEFTPKYPSPRKNEALYETIGKNEAVCVSFRRWSEVSQEVASKRDVCGKEYYEKAMDTMHKLHPNCIFVVFSNDIEWVKQNFEFKYNTVFEDGTDEVWEKLRLMYSCKHFILSPSTFAWWAQYLCRNQKKDVISPKLWYNDENAPCYLIQDNWIKL